jgi:hypothetical protein
MKPEEDEDDFRKRGELDIRIPYQINYWAKELNVSREAIKLAWYEAGPNIEKIKAYLRKKK